MLREDFIKACEMRADGHTFQAIGDSLGYSRQHIQQTMKEMLNSDGIKISSKTIYPNLEREIKIKHKTIKNFIENSGFKYRRINGILYGQTKVLLEDAIFLGEYFNKDIYYLFNKKN